jgi:hypothetical protein
LSEALGALALEGGQVRDFCNFSSEGFEKYKEVIASNALSRARWIGWPK